jgi:leucine-rich repeat kinase 2
VIDALKKQNYHLWYPKSSKDLKMDRLTYSIKESKMVILGLSESFAQDEHCTQMFELVKNIIKKSYVIVEFGKLGAHKWLENGTFASVCSDVRVIMQDPKRFSAKIVELVDSVERQIKDTKTDRQMSQKPPDVFLSYCWQNSHDAVAKGTKSTATSLGWLDPRSLQEFFKQNGIECWLDVADMSAASSGVFGEITKGLNKAKMVVACLSDEYVDSKNCALEFRFAHISLKLPIVKAIVGQGDEWKQNEIAFLAGSYPEVNFQFENKSAYNKLLPY